MKRRIRLTEGDLKRIVSESVKRVLKEGKFINNKRLSAEQLPNYKGRERYKNNFRQSDQVQLTPHHEMSLYDIIFRKDLIRLKKLVREKYGINPSSLHTRIIGNEFSNPNQDVSIEIPANEAFKIDNVKEFMDMVSKLHFQSAPYDEFQERGTICLMYDNKDNPDYEDGYSAHGIRVNNMGKAYQPIEYEPTDWYELNDKGYFD